MKGIILAGGIGSRLFPVTVSVSKQLLPVYDKPMIYYPLSVVMLAGMKDVLIITTPEDSDSFKKLLGDGSQWGIHIQYMTQPSPDGIAQAFILAEEFIGDDDVCLILGDNLFFGQDLMPILHRSVNNVSQHSSATIFGYHVHDPERYGVVEFDNDNNIMSLEEKPQQPKSNYAVTGLYFYPNDVIDKAKVIKPSARGEVEITEVNHSYLNESRLRFERLGRGHAWLDTGTHDSLLEASSFIQTIEKRQGLKVACIEEIAFEMGYISKQQIIQLAKPMLHNQYGQYLMKLAEGKM